MTNIVTVANAKGGVGKTTTSVNMGAGLAELGLRILLIDNDPERHLSNALGISAQSSKHTLSALMSAEINQTDIDDLLQKSIVQAGNLHCIPSNHSLAGMATLLAVKQNSNRVYAEENDVQSEFVLKSILDQLSTAYDYIIIDCGPALDLLTINALAASNQVIIPVQAHYLPEEGLESFIGIIHKIRSNLNPGLEVGGILITMYQGATNLCRSVQQDIQKRFGGGFRVFRQPIPYSIKAAESPAYQKPVLDHDPANPAAQGYRELVKELLENA